VFTLRLLARVKFLVDVPPRVHLPFSYAQPLLTWPDLPTVTNYPHAYTPPCLTPKSDACLSAR
jgi:hypothetical protein